MAQLLLTNCQNHDTFTKHVFCAQVWQQEFAWTEADKPIKLAARALAVPDNVALNRRPMFCFETMMHLVYWSCLVYDYRRVSMLPVIYKPYS